MKQQPATSDPARAAGANRLLAALGEPDCAGLLAECDLVGLRLGQVLLRADRRTTHAYFPLDAIVSLGIAAAGQERCLEVALVGTEGMVGLPLLLGSTASSLRAVVVKPGAGWRIAAASLAVQLRSSAALRRVTQRFVLASLAQLAQAAWCTRYHRVEPRLARWLLMTQDRAPREPLFATHEELAAALGVRRAGVTRAAASLQERHLIAYRRGVLTLLDLPGLQAAACDCYAVDCASYTKLLQHGAA
jgi:CRP-like cAMP-binding protein